MFVTSEEIARLAKASPKFSEMIKKAERGIFDENVPGTQAPSDPNAPSGGMYPMNSAAPQGQQKLPPPEEEEDFAAVPGEEMMQEEPMAEETPEDVGARVAQSFMAPFFDAAMAGDPNAQQMIARAAGHIASSAAESYANAGAMPQDGSMPPDGSIPGGEMQAPAPMSPEEEIANSIVAPQAPAAAPMGEEGGEAGGGGEGGAGESKSTGNGEKKNGEKKNGDKANGDKANGEKKKPFPPKQ